MIPEGSDAISPAPHHDIYSIEDLRQLVYSLIKIPVQPALAGVVVDSHFLGGPGQAFVWATPSRYPSIGIGF